MLKKTLCAVLTIAITASLLFTGCGGYTDSVATLEAQKSTDKYRNFYEIFVYSFYDGNGDGVGDFKGLTQKLDYLNDGDLSTDTDLGIDGIWLMPIMESPSYHKYDVVDYYSINQQYGSMEDFDEFIQKANDRGINVIIDLVLNHTSSQNPWLLKAKEEVEQGNMDGYAKYYSLKPASEVEGKSNYTYLAGDYYYESNFSPTMPELNLSEPKVREEIQKIMKFWLDKGVAGFRLDAVKYFDSADTVGTEFLEWLYKSAQDIKEDVYMVGEDWEGKAQIKSYYPTGIDSLFNFPLGTAQGEFISAANEGKASSIINKVQKWNNELKETNENAIDATFLTNHDMARSANAFSKDLVKEKTGAALYMLMPGNSFIYYGEEVGLGSAKTTSDSFYRTGMPWSYTDLIGHTQLPDVATEEDNPEQSVEEQQQDPNSLLNFYKRIIKIKLQNPEIQRGTIVEKLYVDDSTISGYVTEYNGSKVAVVMNLSDEEKTLAIDSSKFTVNEMRGDLVASQPSDGSAHPKLDGNSITMPPKSFAILK